MNYNHLTIEERCCIRKYYNEGKSFREIAILIGRNVSTISREILHIFCKHKIPPSVLYVYLNTICLFYQYFCILLKRE